MERCFAVGPARLALPLLPEALGAPLRPFSVDATPTHRLSLRSTEGVPPGDPTVPLPRVTAIPGGFELSATGLEARFDAGRNVLDVVRVSSTGELASALRWLLAIALLERDVVLIHGVGLEVNGGAAVFTGHSGAGKSTLGATSGLACIGDELVGIGNAGLAHGTPWNVGRPAELPLRMLGTLAWAKVPALRRVESASWLKLAAENVLLPVPDAAGRARVFQILTSVLAKTAVRELAFAPDASAGRCLSSELSP